MGLGKGHSGMFRKVTIIGVGLIGGSIGKAIKVKGLAKEVVGISPRKETLTAAIKNGAIDHGTTDIKQAVNNADLVILATPVGVVETMLEMISGHIRRNTLVTDACSTKGSIVSYAEEVLPNPSVFVGSHPMAGSEKKGVEFATEKLFEGATCLMTPTEKTHHATVDKVKRFWTALGCEVKAMSPQEHDQALAAVSHTPHLVAYALMESLSEDWLALAGQGLKDTTRIAASTPNIWADIALANGRNIVPSLDEVVRNLSAIRKAIIEKDDKTLLNIFKSAQAKRNKLR